MDTRTIVWRELPGLFKDRIPNGYEEFGFIQETEQELPIGVSVRRYGVQRVGFNCATCHTSTFSYKGQRQIVNGAPAKIDLQAYIRFLVEASQDPRLTPDAVIASAENHGRSIDYASKLVLRYIIFPRLKDEVERSKESFAWMMRRPSHGPGRTDAGNFWRERWGLKPENDDLIGVVDHPSVWNQRIRQEGWYHWDGNNGSLDERNISAALAGGAAEWLLDRHSIGRVSDWLMDLPAPSYPDYIDSQLSNKGEKIFETQCAMCHTSTGTRANQVITLQELGTDPERSKLFSKQMVENFEQVGKTLFMAFSELSADGRLCEYAFGRNMDARSVSS